MMVRRATSIAHLASLVARTIDRGAVLDEPVGHHDMGVNDILVDEGSGTPLGLKE